ncbi:MAG: 3-methyl-2-oxobutanoate hydroxymethyltransferase [Candidatus Omnitrophica bacterium]|nr:3-methyl-2-oxobutanoate hydroxymethyltransferase [Candidatus Omnitrophota bacterium]
MKKRKTVEEIIEKKKRRQKITMLTAYDYPTGLMADQAGIDIVLVGDSLANVVLGLNSTTEVGMEEMLHHTKAVNRAVEQAMLVGDMPYESYQSNTSASVGNAKRFMEEAGCDAVKLEWFDQCLDVVKAIREADIPVMGHVGLTPQTAEKLGGFKVQGKDADSARAIIENTKALQTAGCFAIVLECIPAPIAEIISQELSIPTIGIGAGPLCDGQVLVIHDILGMFDKFRPKFVKRYDDLGKAVRQCIAKYKNDVENGTFPADEHSYHMNKEELKHLRSEYGIGL